MKKQTDVKRIYWEEIEGMNDGILIFELVNGRKLELIYETEETAECIGTGIELVTHLGFRTAL